jgi:siroheme synthase-like protein
MKAPTPAARGGMKAATHGRRASAARRGGPPAPYPLFVDLAGRHCVVIGGGRVAETKVSGLLAAGATVTVVSPSVTGALAEAARAGRIRLERRVYQEGDLAEVALAFAATGETAVNAAVAAEGRRRRVWVNAADDPAHCDFILPAIVRRGALAIAVSTGGASPALARVIREELERTIGDEYGVLVDVVGDVRETLRAEGRAVGADTWRAALADPRLRRLVARGRHGAARRYLRSQLVQAC